MSYEDAVSELQAAAAVDPMVGGSPTPEQPAAAPEVVSPQGENPAPPAEQPVAVPPSEAPAPVDSTEQPFNPDTLPPELIPAWKQLQAAFTPRLQEAADVKKQLDALGGLDTIQEAVDLYQRISDPQNWGQLHSELSEAMQDMGLTPAQANQLAGEELQRQAQAPSLDGLNLDDPDLAPLAQALKAQQAQQAQLQSRLDALTAEQEQRALFEEAQMQQQQRQAQFNQSLTAIQQANPHYKQADLERIVKLSAFHNGDLMHAQSDFELMRADILDGYFAGKQAASSPSIQPQPGAGANSTEERAPQTLRDAEAEAIEYIRGLQAAGELDT